MSVIRVGYGSEWHLLRYLGWHRQRLDELVLNELGGDEITWVDQNLVGSGLLSTEIKGLNFLEPVPLDWPDLLANRKGDNELGCGSPCPN